MQNLRGMLFAWLIGVAFAMSITIYVFSTQQTDTNASQSHLHPMENLSFTVSPQYSPKRQDDTKSGPSWGKSAVENAPLQFGDSTLRITSEDVELWKAAQIAHESSLRIERQPMGTRDPDIVSAFEHVLLTYHPQLPPESIAAIAELAAESMGKYLPPLDDNLRQLVLQSIELAGPGIGNIPLSKSDESLQSGLASLLNECIRWGSTFTVLTGADGTTPPYQPASGARVASDMSSHLSTALTQLFDGEMGQVQAALSRHEDSILDAINYYFSYEGKFPISAKMESELIDQLHTQVVATKERVAAQLKDIEMNNTSSLSATEFEAMRIAALTSESIGLFSTVHQKYKDAIPRAGVFQVPHEYQMGLQALAIKRLEEARLARESQDRIRRVAHFIRGMNAISESHLEEELHMPVWSFSGIHH